MADGKSVPSKPYAARPVAVALTKPAAGFFVTGARLICDRAGIFARHRRTPHSFRSLGFGGEGSNRSLLHLIKFQRQSVRVAEKREPLIRIWVDANWFNCNASGLKARNCEIEIHYGERQMSQTCRLWI